MHLSLSLSLSLSPCGHWATVLTSCFEFGRARYQIAEGGAADGKFDLLTRTHFIFHFHSHNYSDVNYCRQFELENVNNLGREKMGLRRTVLSKGA